MSQSELERRGLTTTAAPNDGMRDWTNKATGEVHQVPKGIDPGFDYIPMRSINQVKQQQLAKRKAPLYQAPERLIHSAFSTIKGVNVDGLNRVLAGIAATSSAPQVAMLGKFIQGYDIKSLFLKQAEMGFNNSGAKAIEQASKDYINGSHFHPRQYYTTRHYRKSWGFTSKSYDNVNIKAASSIQLSKVNVNELRQAVALADIQASKQQAIFSLSSVVRNTSESGNHGGTVVTWLHEIGHQLHFKAGSPAVPVSAELTRYSGKNKFEWHAEHFAAWVLNRNALAEFNSEIAEYFDKLVETVVTQGGIRG